MMMKRASDETVLQSLGLKVVQVLKILKSFKKIETKFLSPNTC